MLWLFYIIHPKITAWHSAPLSAAHNTFCFVLKHRDHETQNYCNFSRWGQLQVPISTPAWLCSLYIPFSLAIIDMTTSFCRYLITVKSSLIACCSQNRFLNLKYTIEILFVYFTLVISVNTTHICILISMQMQSSVSL